MHITLIGADLEENLGLGMIAAVAREAGHAVDVAAFDDGEQLEAIVERVLRTGPAVVGLGMQFQHRTSDFLALARRLRAAGFTGHITCGGQFPTLAHDALLAEAGTPIDSAVLHDGEGAFIELLEALEQGGNLRDVPGLALAEGGDVRCTPPRPLDANLDALPFPYRYRRHAEHVGVPFIPVTTARGCWGRCHFCAITATYRDARERSGCGALLRERSAEHVAAELAALWHGAGGRAVFCFHDDTLLRPRAGDSLDRLEAMLAAMARHGVDRERLAIVGKCRPDSLTPELAHELAERGVVRLFVGVENASQAGSDRLGRGIDVARAQAALDACREAGIFVCYNLLCFEPGATLADLEDNIAFMRRNAHFPINFCRAEAYTGTRLQKDLEADGRLRGSYLGYDYRIADDRGELAFRIAAAVFRQRNFARRGVHNRFLGLGYSAKLVERFYPEQGGRRAALLTEAAELTRSIVLETAGFFDEVLALAAELDPRDEDRVMRHTALLALRVSEADRYQHARLDRVFADLEAYAQLGRSAAQPPLRSAWRESLRRFASALAVAGLLGAGPALAGCGESHGDSVPDSIWPSDDAPGPQDDIWPTDDAANPDMVVDPAPLDLWPTDDAPNPDVFVPRPDAGPTDGPTEVGPGDASPAQGALEPAFLDGIRLARAAQPAGAFTDSGPQARRTPDLPLHTPPQIALRVVTRAEGDAQGYEVRLRCDASPISLRWEGDGQIAGEGAVVRWQPATDGDQLRVVVRSAGGIAVTALRHDATRKLTRES